MPEASSFDLGSRIENAGIGQQHPRLVCQSHENISPEDGQDVYEVERLDASRASSRQHPFTTSKSSVFD
jgi:hypothetical protein